MAVLRNIGLLILLVIFGGIGYVVREGMLVWEENKALKENPELAQVDEAVRSHIARLEENVSQLAMQRNEAQEKITELMEELDEVKATEAKYFNDLLICEGKAPETVEGEDVVETVAPAKNTAVPAEKEEKAAPAVIVPKAVKNPVIMPVIDAADTKAETAETTEAE